MSQNATRIEKDIHILYVLKREMRADAPIQIHVGHGFALTTKSELTREIFFFFFF